ncbi:MAG: phosphoribosyltransferase [Candidatus Ranarchaeia archaeon]
MVKGPKVKILSWQDVYDYAFKTSQNIKTSDYRPNAIVGITRGGWVHARTQCDFLGIKDLYAVKVEHWGITARPDGSARLTVPITPDYIKGKNILVVDDVTDTGKSLTLAVDHLRSFKAAADIKTATLLHIKGSEFVPDFHSGEVEWAWFTFPWNYYEDMTNLVMNLFEGENMTIFDSSEKISTLLKQYNGISRTKEQLSTVKKHMIWLGKLKNTAKTWERA